MIDKKNLARFVSCTQEEYDNRKKDNKENINMEEENNNGNNTKSNVSKV